ncbi:MAG: hypothetical protein DMG37_13980 [Acidobacteria bacterium]|nr:MAG: hypothetical protein DMG37_13980 [Acidobacteriota bacterium]
MKITRIRVQSSAGPYLVVAGAGAIGRGAQEITALGHFSSVHFVSSPKVWRAVGKIVQRGLRLSNRNGVHLFSDSESAKHLGSVEQIARSLSRAGADRKSLVLAVGGGVVGDVAGFVAASYLRGVALVQIPTTLVAQVDSSIGGKTGVNLPEGKNLVGAFYPPRLVVTDPDLLRSLPPREFRGGLAEVIKHAVIADALMFARLEKDMDKILRRDRDVLGSLVPRNVQIKARVVSRDERESFLGHEIGLTPAEDVSRIVSLVCRLGPLPPWPAVSLSTLVKAMHSDKKTRSGVLRFVLSPRLGQARTYDKVPVNAVERILHFTPRLIAAATERPGVLK